MSVLTSLSLNSRVWIYQSDVPFAEETLPKLKEQVNAFAQAWTSHNNALQSNGLVLHRYFIVLVVDESRAGASGCSIDKSVKFIQSIEHTYNVRLFDRFNFAYRDETNEIQVVSKDVFAERYQNGIITDSTTVFNNLVKNLGELEQKWEIALSDSWHKRFV